MGNKQLFALAIGAAMLSAGPAVMAKGKKPELCDGRVANVIGTNKGDLIVLADVRDLGNVLIGVDVTINNQAPQHFLPNQVVVSGGNGNDTIVGSSSNDVICGGNGEDTIEGRNGNDRIYGQNGKDALYGDLNPNPDNNVPAGEVCTPNSDINSGPLVSCDDTIYGGNAKDDIEGGLGTDVLFGENGKDSLSSGDPLNAGNGSPNSVLNGGRGKDVCQDISIPDVNFIDCEQINP